MATFLDLVKARMSEALLIELTRQDDHATDATVNDDILQTAINDATGEFALLVGYLPDPDVSLHVPCMIEGVLYYLRTYKDLESNATREIHIRFDRKCQALQKQFSTKPRSGSALTPSQEVRAGQVIRPDMDRSNFYRYLPRARTRDDFYGG